MTWGPFLLCLCQEVLLRRFQCTFFSYSIFLKTGTVYDYPSNKWAKPSPTEGKLGRMPVLSRLKVFSRQVRTYIPCTLLPFHAFRQVPFSSHTDFRRFLSNLPPPLFTSIFTSFSEPHQSVIFVLGAKVIPGLDGNARSSLPFSAKISSPSGSIFPKNSSIICWIA